MVTREKNKFSFVRNVVLLVLFLSSCLIVSKLSEESQNFGAQQKGRVSNLEDPWMQEQEKRMRLLKKACEKIRHGKPPMATFSLARRREKLLNHLIVEDRHRVLYCYIPKIACTNWKRLIMILSARSNETDPLNIPSYLPHWANSTRILSSASFKSSQVSERLGSYIKFLIVRHPFERLVSAYRNKIESNTTTARKFQGVYGTQIIKDYKLGTHIPFSKFVDYLLSLDSFFKRDKLDEHWAPYVDLCHPCDIPYDFIGKYETISEDAEAILRKIGAPQNIHFPTKIGYSNITADLIPEYFRNLTAIQKSRLVNMFKSDFSIFGYNYTNYV